ALAPFIARDRWDSIPCRVEANVDRLLRRFADNHAKATFFTLGWIAERYPQVVRRIVDDGHELASHGYGHQRASELSREAFSHDVTNAKRILEDIAGVRVIGYRAPSFSIGADNLWAFDVLKEAGYVYSSSVYPVQHDHYGACARAQPAGRRRRVLPLRAVRRVALGDRPLQPRRAGSGDLLHASVG